MLIFRLPMVIAINKFTVDHHLSLLMFASFVTATAINICKQLIGDAFRNSEHTIISWQAQYSGKDLDFLSLDYLFFSHSFYPYTFLFISIFSHSYESYWNKYHEQIYCQFVRSLRILYFSLLFCSSSTLTTSSFINTYFLSFFLFLSSPVSSLASSSSPQPQSNIVNSKTKGNFSC